MDLPKPAHWQDFETIVRDAQAQRWKSTTLTKNGRSGQKQAGVDIYGHDEIGRPVGIQCKRYKPPLALNRVADEIAKAAKFKGRLTTLFIATTADHDANLQEQVRVLSDARVARGEFAVALLFWDEIVAGLLLNPAVFRAHYPQIMLADTQVVDKERLIGALELGYRGADLWAYVKLTYGECGWMAQADPDELIANLRVMERRTQQLLPPDDAAPILASLAEVRDGCLAPKTAEADWDPIEDYARRVSSRLRASSSLLPFAESNMLDLALQLGRIYHNTDDLPAAEVRADVEAKVRSILSTTSDKTIKAKFADAKKLSEGYRWAMRVYALIDHEIRFRI